MSEDQARRNMVRFEQDLLLRGIQVAEIDIANLGSTGQAESDLWEFGVVHPNGSVSTIMMPGCTLEDVRCPPGGGEMVNVDGTDWYWAFAVEVFVLYQEQDKADETRPAQTESGGTSGVVPDSGGVVPPGAS